MHKLLKNDKHRIATDTAAVYVNLVSFYRSRASRLLAGGAPNERMRRGGPLVVSFLFRPSIQSVETLYFESEDECEIDAWLRIP